MSKEIETKHLFASIKKLIEKSKQQIAIFVNVTMSILYWQIGKQINEVVLKNQRAEYGKQIVATLSRQLIQQYGNNFEEKNLRRIIQFAQLFSEEKIVVSVIRQLSWTHILAILPIEDPLKREFYIQRSFSGTRCSLSDCSKRMARSGKSDQFGRRKKQGTSSPRRNEAPHSPAPSP